MLTPHFKETAERIRCSPSNDILAIQDGTVLNYSTHTAKKELGRVGNTRDSKKPQQGIIQHSTLCVTPENEALGLMDLAFYTYDDFASDIDSDKRPLEEKKTLCWVNGIKNLRHRLGDTARNKRIITVSDRESDFFEFMHYLVVNNETFIVRCKSDRYLGEATQKGDTLKKSLDKQTPLGAFTALIPSVETRTIQEVTLQLKCLETITMPVPRWVKTSNPDKNYNPIQLNVVMAYHEEYSWILLSNMPVETIADCMKIVGYYKQRWHIEDYHKVLKTGYQIDELYLHSSRIAIENALTIAAMSACRLYWIIFTGRVEKNITADKLFKEYEWQCVYLFFNEPIPLEPPPVREIILQIARLGGFKPTKDKTKLPGIKVMWLGFQKFEAAATMFKQCQAKLKAT